MPESQTNITFKLNLCINCLSFLNDAASRSKSGMAREKAAMDAGIELANGSNDVRHLETIAHWKSARRRALLQKNSERVLMAALDIARSSADASEKIRVLKSLDGVGVRMGSAILTAMYPERYTVIDVRALDSLGVRGHVDDFSLYPVYLEFCIATAADLGMPLRDLDRALWKAGAA